MKKYIILTLALFLTFSLNAFAQNPYANPNRVNVRGYHRQDGTYVRSHQRTAPNSTTRDNLSYSGY